MRSFEDDPKLLDMLSPERLKRLLSLIETLSSHSLRLEEKYLKEAEPVEFNLECLAWLHCPGRPDVQQAAARLLEFILMYVGKYRLAANMHHDTTRASYAELERQNIALQVSEARFRLLSEELQTRVDAQVKIIEKTQRQLYESARLRAVGQLAAGVAHEINNPVGFISSNLRVASDYLNEISEKLPDDKNTHLMLEDFRALLSESVSGARRIATIVTDLKTFSNIDQADFTPCSLNALLGTTCHLLQAEHKATLPLRMELTELSPLAGYPAKLSQAFYNILDNAVKALEKEGGEIRIISRQHQATQEIIIEDNGCGIPQDVQACVFDPFFTTRPVGAGSGLGLTVARDVIAAHEGEIQLDSQEGQGTRITLRFWNK
ncbi:signal transduction histidine kinase [Pseudomonas duriflava]|uniref:histidine kinase n=1 Tax=Pseudomonas duriflava TaxID=459528 RepID=A0A562QPR8_9PSED|nr:ATP-binding protein [Pseudomonas duriflava]TWI58673.1 signal transduction histidine kinase [Pseudomonas duriflava]